jgi:hypothetical protein
MKKEKAVKLTEEETRFFRYLRERQSNPCGFPFEECARWAAEQYEHETRDALRVEAARLEALDVTPDKELVDSAHTNAGDTCRERFEDAGNHPYYSTQYLRHFTATLSMLLDETEAEAEESNEEEGCVEVNGNQVSLTVSYSIPNVESDCNTFSELFGGWRGTTQEQAVEVVIESVRGWANEMRTRFPDVCVWDDAGNHY